MVGKKYKKKELIPAFISTLHTFGRSLVFNPHIHIILLDGGISNKTREFISIDFFSYPAFRKRFMKILLDLLEDDVGKDEFRKIKNDLYFRYKDGFYVYAPPSKFKSYVDLVKYVCRYVARPVMAESRILDYDGTLKINISVSKLLTKEKADFKKTLTSWRNLITLSFQIDPLSCPICRDTMIYYKSVLPKGVYHYE